MSFTRLLPLSLIAILGSAATVQAQAPETCHDGYVWREAAPGDLVCVPPASHDLVAHENATEDERRTVFPTNIGGTHDCLDGFVRREATPDDLVCVTPARHAEVQAENAQADARAVGGAGQHILVFGVTNTRHIEMSKTFTSVCGTWHHGYGNAYQVIGWGQAEIGWLGDNCMAFVHELAVGFDLTLLDSLPFKSVDRGELTWDEYEASQNCLLVLGYVHRCWQNGDGAYEDKPGGCAIVVISALDWRRVQVPEGLLQRANPAPPVTLLSRGRWLVTQALTWRTSPPLGAPLLDTGFALVAPFSLRDLTAQDNAVCVSRIENIRLTVT